VDTLKFEFIEEFIPFCIEIYELFLFNKMLPTTATGILHGSHYRRNKRSCSALLDRLMMLHKPPYIFGFPSLSIWGHSFLFPQF